MAAHKATSICTRSGAASCWSRNSDSLAAHMLSGRLRKAAIVVTGQAGWRAKKASRRACSASKRSSVPRLLSAPYGERSITWRLLVGSTGERDFIFGNVTELANRCALRCRVSTSVIAPSNGAAGRISLLCDGQADQRAANSPSRSTSLRSLVANIGSPRPSMPASTSMALARYSRVLTMRSGGKNWSLWVSSAQRPNAFRCACHCHTLASPRSSSR